ncbi:FI18412p1 [Strongyloides ratti]|uniref:FI18412p1 n=1 Tax=Strongyloides ratti TaxID=34506 RepID=A0A090LKT5_STRRB|nr:FI18412p1 [Strongyloides ratti]CEF70444.1 FI18412p1 [Strongyloides ratti]
MTSKSKMNQDEFNGKFGKINTENDLIKKISKQKIFEKLKIFIKNTPDRMLSFLPIISWLPKYKFNEYFHGDMIAGLTSGIMAVPQSMAYSSLAGVSPIYGLYSTFFAAIIYMFFGTSKHIAIGVFAVVSMMTGAVTAKYSSNNGDEENIDIIELISTIAFTVGSIQLIMGILRLNFIATYMSDALISGFTTGSACHVFMSQLSKVFGYKIPKYSDIGMLVFMLRDIIKNIYKTNLINLGLTIIAIIFLVIGKEIISPRIKKYTSIPIPFELILVIITTILSSIFNFKENYNINIVDNIPQSFPMPKLPNFKLIPLVFTDCISIAIVCYILVISMAKLFARKHKYHVDTRQEMYACSFMCLLSCFFPVYPTGASLSRSSVLEATGVKSQLNVLFSTSLLFVVIIWIGKYLEPLPLCILASIVMVGLKTLFLQFKDLKHLWNINKFDFIIWIVSFITTVFGTVTLGLIISLGFVILTVVIREQIVQLTELGSDKDNVYFKSLDSYKNIQAQKGNINIYKFDKPLHFANAPSFTEKIIEKFDEINLRRNADSLVEIKVDEKEIIFNKLNEKKKIPYYFILDCSSINYIDSMGLDSLKKIKDESINYKITLLFCNFSEEILTLLGKLKDEIILSDDIFPSINDSLMYIEKMMF